MPLQFGSSFGHIVTWRGVIDLKHFFFLAILADDYCEVWIHEVVSTLGAHVVGNCSPDGRLLVVVTIRNGSHDVHSLHHVGTGHVLVGLQVTRVFDKAACTDLVKLFVYFPRFFWR